LLLRQLADLQSIKYTQTLDEISFIFMTKDIRKIVKEGYKKGDYVSHFRTNSQPNKIEKKFLDRLAGLVPRAAKILDFGCGIGIPFDKYLIGKSFKVTGIDITRKHIERAKENVPDAKFVEGDFSRMHLDNERFHAIIAVYSVFHIPREEQQDLFQSVQNDDCSGQL